MFSQLGPLFKTVFRNTEHADARLEIRRDEKRDGRRKTEFEEHADDNSMWEDSTDVSVEGLKVFLNNFVRGMDGHEKNTAPSGIENAQDISPAPAHLEPTNTTTARAIGAYQSMAQKSGSAAPPVIPAEKTSADVDLMHAQDVRVIYKLIEDLEIISARGVQTLTIQRANTFLESLANAVVLAKTGL